MTGIRTSDEIGMRRLKKYIRRLKIQARKRGFIVISYVTLTQDGGEITIKRLDFPTPRDQNDFFRHLMKLMWAGLRFKGHMDPDTLVMSGVDFLYERNKRGDSMRDPWGNIGVRD